MPVLFTRPWLRSLSGLFINFSYGYFALAIVTPNLVNLSLSDPFASLTWNVFLGILFLLASVKTEELVENE